MLTLYQNPTAVCAVKVRLVLAEKELAWEARNLDLRAGDQHKPEYLKLNPNGVVPTLVHGDRVLSKSSVIMLYLDEAFPQRALQPSDPWQRAQMRLWMKRVDEALMQQHHLDVHDEASAGGCGAADGRAGSPLRPHPEPGRPGASAPSDRDGPRRP